VKILFYKTVLGPKRLERFASLKLRESKDSLTLLCAWLVGLRMGARPILVDDCLIYHLYQPLSGKKNPAPKGAGFSEHFY
jgi:hypothetical protein